MMMRFVSIVATLIVTSLFATPVAARAAEPTLVLDSLSFLFFEGSRTGSILPLASIPMKMTQRSPTDWTVTIDPAVFEIPPTQDASGAVVGWKLAEPATGTLHVSGSEASCSISAPLLAFPDGTAEGIPVPLEFTTETTAASAAGAVASRQGARLDLASGYLQLVATGVDWTEGAALRQDPYFVVLSGRIEGLPASLNAAP